MKLQDFLKLLLLHLSVKLTPFIDQKKTGKYHFGIEVNLSQGGIGEVFIENNSKERLT